MKHKPSKKVIVVGGAPSSGTTLVADLLDSVPGLGCDPELGIFASADAYTWSDDFVERALAHRTFPTTSAYSADRTFFNEKYLDLVGLNNADLDRLIEASTSLPNFIERFRQHREAFRERPISVLVEKTPVNIAVADRFLETFNQGVFVHVVRDPRHVVGSLVFRGKGIAEATVVWSQQVAHGARLIGHDRLITVTYEDLLTSPFETAVRLASAVGIKTTPQAVRARFESNDFRASIPRVESWRVPTYDGTVRQPGDDRLSDMDRGWIERQSIWSVHPDTGVRFNSSIGLLAGQFGYTSRVVNKARFDLNRLAAVFKQFARADRAFDNEFCVTDPKYVVGAPDRLSKASLSEWRGFLDAARPWIPVETLEQIGMQAAQRVRHQRNMESAPITKRVEQ